jgi:hypothetical protein
VARELTHHELGNDSDAIVRALEGGESFVVTRHGVAGGELLPLRRHFVSAEAVVASFAGAPTVDAARFRADLDAVIDQDAEPRR